VAAAAAAPTTPDTDASEGSLDDAADGAVPDAFVVAGMPVIGREIVLGSTQTAADVLAVVWSATGDALPVGCPAPGSARPARAVGIAVAVPPPSINADHVGAAVALVAPPPLPTGTALVSGCAPTTGAIAAGWIPGEFAAPAAPLVVGVALAAGSAPATPLLAAAVPVVNRAAMVGPTGVCQPPAGVVAATLWLAEPSDAAVFPPLATVVADEVAAAP